MIKFFRQIRQRLLTENPPAGRAGKFSKYLLYAIGEIVLVVVGILIALSINNWNEQQKRDVLEKEYYCRLKEDVRQDEEKIESLIIAVKKRLVASNEAARLLQKSDPLKTEVGRQFEFALKGSYSTFVANNAAFEDLKSGANLNIIKDKRVINALNNYFNKIKGYTDVIRVHTDLMVNNQFSYSDKLSTGWVHGKMTTSRFLKGMDKDVFNAINISEQEYFSEEIKYSLYNDALLHISSNARTKELLMLIKEEIYILLKLFDNKCDT